MSPDHSKLPDFEMHATAAGFARAAADLARRVCRYWGRRGFNDGWPMTTSPYLQSVGVQLLPDAFHLRSERNRSSEFAAPPVSRVWRTARDWVFELLWRMHLTYPPSR